MSTELNDYMDGDRELEELSPEARAEAEAWRRLTGEMKADEPKQAPPWMENAVMSEIALASAPRESVFDWLLRPRDIRLSPMTSLAMAAAVVALFVLLPNRVPVAPPLGPVAVTEILVEFSLEAPGATTVAVAGDFSGWESDFVLEDADGDGIWTGRIPITPGLHKYMFVIDGTDWVTDPGAQRYADDGFGNRNAVLRGAPEDAVSMGTRRSAGAPALAPAPTLARTRTAGAILLALALHPAGAFGQWGDLRIEVGGSQAFAPSGTDVAAATYLTAGLQVDRWTRSGSGVFAGVSGGMATGSIGGDWGSFVLGGKAVAGAGGPVELSLSATTYGFRVGGRFSYEALTVVSRPEVRIPLGPAAIVLYGEGGKGSSNIEFRRDTLVRAFSQDLWHYGGGPELQLRLGRTLTSASYGVLETEAGRYRRGEFKVRAGTDRSLVSATLSVWDTPLGTETTGIISVTVPLGGPNWLARLVGGRTDPDPLVRSEPGGQGGLIIGRRLVRFGPRSATPVVELRATSGGAAARFRLENQVAQRIEVLGDFLGWEPQAMLRDGRAWVLEIPLAAGTYHFGFLVDGEWFVPEGAPGQVSDDWGQMNATIVVP